MADGAIFLVDVKQGVNEQVRFVAKAEHTSALEEIRAEFKTKIWDLLVESDAPEDKLDFPVLQACAKDVPQLLNELFDAIINGVLAPTARVKEPLQMLGRFMTGKITAGVHARNEKVKALRPGVVEEGKMACYEIDEVASYLSWAS
uniref:Uncharacterized protein n=1 Tax=Tanacetum cinerariifolium TaxID=118510 RepID=A0A6L2JDL0_TANCI|nr:hypothetical protein [Tanacetum cinerariifolium]